MDLPWNAKRCPKDSAPLSWESFAGLRVYRIEGTRKVYRCRCDKCHRHYEIRRATNGR
jgi:hypothetical protein